VDWITINRFSKLSAKINSEQCEGLTTIISASTDELRAQAFLISESGRLPADGLFQLARGYCVERITTYA